MCFIRTKRNRLNKYRVSKYLFFMIMLAFFSLNCEAEDQPPQIGNFILPNSQQPGPMIGFGENILNKNETQLFLFADGFKAVNQHFIDVVPAVLYGITPSLSIFINAPYAASFQTRQQKSEGFEDAFAQLEYEFYNSSTKSFVDQATVVINMTVPTGSNQKTPPTGFGTPSYFMGTTFNRTWVDWFLFSSPGAILTTAKNGTKFGNSYLYQFGFGRNILDIDGWLLAWMVEIDGTYTQKNRVSGLIDPNSGGNIVYVTPSFWASTRRLIFQFGVGVPATQHWYGNQPRDVLLFAANMGWSIY